MNEVDSRYNDENIYDGVRNTIEENSSIFSLIEFLIISCRIISWM